MSKLGFGTPALMALPSRRDQFALLEAVVEAGITHFDTSPYYGYGAVEPLLGEFLAAHKVKGTVTTKFGIQPPPALLRSSAVMKLARTIAGLSPGLKRLLSRGASKMVTQGAFDAESAEKSLLSSLRNLRLERVDYFLLHEPTLTDTRRPGLETFLQRSLAAGQIGAFGIGAAWPCVQEVLAHAPTFASVVQFDNPLPEDRVPLAAGNRTIITYGNVGPTVRAIRERLANNPRELEQWQKVWPIDPRDDSTLGAALLSLAVARNPTGIVLFATRDVGRLQRNVQAVRNGDFSPAQLSAVQRILTCQANDCRL
jgi:aryl-alcohol dehydrogenase-like predicted oxidoreductase